MENVVEMSWRELNYIFIFIKYQKAGCKIWSYLRKYPISRNDINALKREGWRFSIEFSHIFYDYIAGSAFNKSEKEIIAEWTARRTRRNHKLLRHAIRSFGLEPSIYDASSYKAFSRNSFADLEYKFKVNMMGNMS